MLYSYLWPSLLHLVLYFFPLSITILLFVHIIGCCFMKPKQGAQSTIAASVFILGKFKSIIRTGQPILVETIDSVGFYKIFFTAWLTSLAFLLWSLSGMPFTCPLAFVHCEILIIMPSHFPQTFQFAQRLMSHFFCTAVNYWRVCLIYNASHKFWDPSPPPLSMLFASIWDSFLAQASALLLCQYAATLSRGKGPDLFLESGPFQDFKKFF